MSGTIRRAAAYLVYLTMLDAAEGRPVAVSHQQLVDRTSLSKRAVPDAIDHLAQRGLLEVKGRGRTEPATVALLHPWLR